MNERIRELGRQVGFYMAPTHPGGFPNEDLLVIEKFAELIILECANIARREDHDPYECILSHFGVETVDDTLRTRSTYFGNDV